MTDAAGTLEVLSIGRGHLTLTITDGNEMEMEKGRRVIEDMLRRGYSIYVDTDGPDKPMKKVRKFDRKRLVYHIDDSMDTVPATEGDTPAAETPKDARGRKRTREVPATTAKATAVGRTAGGPARDILRPGDGNLPPMRASDLTRL